MTVLAGQAEVDRGRLATVAVARQLAVLEVGTLISLEIGIDLVGGDQRGQQRLAGVDQVAGGDQRPADAAVDGRGHAGEGEIQLRAVQLRLNRRGCRAGFAGGTDAGVGELVGNRVLLAQAFAAFGFGDGALLVGASLLQLRLQALDLGLERARVDLEQEVAFLHQRAFLEGHLVDETGHARADLHRLRRFQAASEFIPLGHLLFDDFRDADGGRRHARLGGLRCLATSGGDQHRQGDKGKTQGVERTFHA